MHFNYAQTEGLCSKEDLMPNENSLKNLKPMWTSDTAREAQKNSVLARKANAEARAALKLSMSEWSKYKTEVLEETEMSSLDVLKILMMKALEAQEYDTAAEYAKTLAEFEAPKLARVDQTNTDITAEDLTDEELEEKIKTLLK